MAKPRYLELIEKHDPELLQARNALESLVREEGALSPKLKLLMAMLCDALLGRPEGVKALANAARLEGATEDEIVETVRVALHMGGIPALVCATSAYKED